MVTKMDLGNPLALSGESVSPLNPIRKEYFRTPTFPIVNHVLSLNKHAFSHRRVFIVPIAIPNIQPHRLKHSRAAKMPPQDNISEVLAFFPDFPKAHAYLRELATSLGVTIVTRGASRPLPPHFKGYGKKNYARVDFGCSRGRKAAGAHTTQMTECPYRAKIVYFPYIEASHPERVSTPWGLTIIHPEHNHQPSIHIQSSNTWRRQERKAMEVGRSIAFDQEVENLSADGCHTAISIANILSKNMGLFIDVEMVKGAQKRLRNSSFRPDTATQRFLRELQEDKGITFHVYEDPDTNRISRIFWTYETCIIMWRNHPEIISFDSTYRTNRFNMPLLQMGGVTGLHTNFAVAFALLSDETEESFSWALDRLAHTAQNVWDSEAEKYVPREHQISFPLTIMSDYDTAFKNAAKRVFPIAQQQLCIWHVMKNVVYNVRRLWDGVLGSFAGGRRAGPGDEDDREPVISTDAPEYEDNAADPPEIMLANTLSQQPPEEESEFEYSPIGIVQAWRKVIYCSEREKSEELWSKLKDFFSRQPS
jgi:hypothetical protein